MAYDQTTADLIRENRELRERLRAILEPLRELDAKATPGPWEHDGVTGREDTAYEMLYGPDGSSTICDTSNAGMREMVYDGDFWVDRQGRANLLLVAGLRNALPELLKLAACSACGGSRFVERESGSPARMVKFACLACRPNP